MSKPFIPFGVLPGHWGLKGMSREMAQAEYELDGLELDLALTDIINREDEQARILRHLEINYKWKVIEEKEFDYGIADLRGDALTLLKVKLKHQDITQKEYDKEIATLDGEPWVDIPEVTFDKDNPGGGALSLDWNDIFIEMLEEAGYTAPTQEGTVDLWLTDLCRNIAMEELAGTGVFDEESEQAMELKRKRLDDGKIEIS